MAGMTDEEIEDLCRELDEIFKARKLAAARSRATPNLKPNLSGWPATDFMRLEQAIRRYGNRGNGVERREAINRLSHEQAWRLPYMNPYSADIWRQLLHQALVAHGILDMSPMMITLIDYRWDTSTAIARIMLLNIRRKVMRLLKGLDYFVNIEFAVHCDIKRDGGYLITPHIHGIVWGRDIERRIAPIRGLFRGGMDNATGVNLQAAYDVAGAVTYMVKAPMCGYGRFERNNGKVERPIEQFSGPLRFRVFQLFRRFTFPDMAIAGGLGVTVLRDALQATKNQTAERH